LTFVLASFLQLTRAVNFEGRSDEMADAAATTEKPTEEVKVSTADICHLRSDAKRS
jgi:hypothetical protein